MWDVCVVGKQIIVISPLCSPVSPLTPPLTPQVATGWYSLQAGVGCLRLGGTACLVQPSHCPCQTPIAHCLGLAWCFYYYRKLTLARRQKCTVQSKRDRAESGQNVFTARGPWPWCEVPVCWEQWVELDTLPLPVLCTCYNNITTVPVTNTTTPPGHHGPKHQGPASHTEADHSVFQEGWSSSGQSSDESSQSNVVYGHWHWLYLHLRWELPGHQSYSLPQWTAVPCIRQVSTYSAIGFL